ncbi:MAG: response regulator [bacterium]
MSNKSINVFMIDDNPADGETVRRFLSADSIPREINLTVCLDPRQAEQLINNQDFDLIIIDYHFPFGTGFDLLKKLRNSGIEIPAIMLTGQGSELVAAEAVSARLDGYIPKNKLSSETLKNSIQRVLETKNSTPDHTPERRKKTMQKSDTLATAAQFLQRLNKNLQKNPHSPFFLIQLKHSDQQKETPRLLQQIFHGTLKKSLGDNTSLYQIRDQLAAGFCSDFSEKTPSFSTLSNNLIEMLLQLDIIESQDQEETKNIFSLTGLKIDYSSNFFDPAHLLNRGIDHMLQLKSSQRFEEIKITYKHGRSYNNE